MAKYVFAYHGGSHPTTDEEVKAVMAAWTSWLEGMGSAVVDGGNPVGPSKTVSTNGVEEGGGSNPLSGYSLIEADSMEAALAHAKNCPIISSQGTVEVAEAMEM